MNKEIIGLSKDGTLDVDKVVEFFQNWVGVHLIAVKGQLDSYWLMGKDGYDMMEGRKYYKLVFTGYGVEIVSPGMCNGYAMKCHLAEWIKEAIDARKYEDSYKKSA